jgi:hypothetical protein
MSSTNQIIVIGPGIDKESVLEKYAHLLNPDDEYIILTEDEFKEKHGDIDFSKMDHLSEIKEFKIQEVPRLIDGPIELPKRERPVTSPKLNIKVKNHKNYGNVARNAAKIRNQGRQRR